MKSINFGLPDCLPQRPQEDSRLWESARRMKHQKLSRGLIYDEILNKRRLFIFYLFIRADLFFSLSLLTKVQSPKRIDFSH